MDALPDYVTRRAEALRKRTGRDRMNLLRAELTLSLTIAASAQAHYEGGESDLVREAIRRAEQGYAFVALFLADPTEAAEMSEDQRRELASALERLRAALDRLTGDAP